MNRRRLLAALALVPTGAMAVAPTGAVAQTPPTIGVLVISEEHYAPAQLQQAMQERGWRPGSYRLDVKFAQGKVDRLDALARELVAARVNAIVALYTPSALAAKRATTTIPIVMSAGDPVGNGIVSNVTRPEGNITGIDSAAASLSGKRVEVLREASPSLRRLGVFINPPDPFSRSLVEQVKATAAKVDISVEVIPALDPDQAMRAAAAARIDGVVVQPSLQQRPLAERLLRARLPGVSGERSFVDAGGLLSVNSSALERYRAIALNIDRILKGAAPRDLPILQASQFDIFVNRTTAKTYGLTLPQLLLSRAEEIVD
jgi:putative ABC transport system substrate-binding protein